MSVRCFDFGASNCCAGAAAALVSMRLALLAAAVATVAFIFFERKLSEHEEQNAKISKKKRRFEKGMHERDYLPLIPVDELKLVRKLLKSIGSSRGWPCWPIAAMPAQMDDAWHQALHAAKLESGGAWNDFFSPSDLDPVRLRKLSKVVDTVFLGNVFEKELRRRRLPDLDFVVDDAAIDQGDWISYFDESNAIHLLRHKWSQELSEGRPMSCEGVLCTTRLQLLIHTIAHEMVHAIVYHTMPSIDKSSEAYLPDERHGPIFKLMNNRLFGHASDSYKHVFGPPAAHAT